MRSFVIFAECCSRSPSCWSIVDSELPPGENVGLESKKFSYQYMRWKDILYATHIRKPPGLEQSMSHVLKQNVYPGGEGSASEAAHIVRFYLDTYLCVLHDRIKCSEMLTGLVLPPSLVVEKLG